MKLKGKGLLLTGGFGEAAVRADHIEVVSPLAILLMQLERGYDGRIAVGA